MRAPIYKTISQLKERDRLLRLAAKADLVVDVGYQYQFNTATLHRLEVFARLIEKELQNEKGLGSE